MGAGDPSSGSRSNAQRCPSPDPRVVNQEVDNAFSEDNIQTGVDVNHKPGPTDPPALELEDAQDDSMP